jgi:hypothetical protein
MGCVLSYTGHFCSSVTIEHASGLYMADAHRILLTGHAVWQGIAVCKHNGKWLTTSGESLGTVLEACVRTCIPEGYQPHAYQGMHQSHESSSKFHTSQAVAAILAHQSEVLSPTHATLPTQTAIQQWHIPCQYLRVRASSESINLQHLHASHWHRQRLVTVV